MIFVDGDLTSVVAVSDSNRLTSPGPSFSSHNLNEPRSLLSGGTIEPLENVRDCNVRSLYPGKKMRNF